MNKYPVGTLAYLDTFLGLIPCKVLEIKPDAIYVQITVSRKGYRKGEKIYGFYTIIPRKQICVKNHKYVINTNFEWI